MTVDSPLGIGVVAAALLLAGCGADPSGVGRTPDNRAENLICSIPTSDIQSGGPGKDGIPALTNPPLTGSFDAGAQYLRDFDRVIGIVLPERTVAIPLNILWWHEIVNMDVGPLSLAVTHCPLTGSSLVFDRGPMDGAEFGVSGLLFQNNMLMYNRSTGESLWPQMSRGARCGPRDGTELDMIASTEMSWAGWRSLHPNTFVVGSNTGHDRDYNLYPYGRYDDPTNAELLFPLSGGVDRRRPPKERVLGIPEGEGEGVALPYGELRRSGNLSVANLVADGREIVVLWSSAAEGAAAFEPFLEDGTRVTLRVKDGAFVDEETGSVWGLHGSAYQGPLRFRRLKPYDEAYVAYWFAWAAFHPETRIWPNE